MFARDASAARALRRCRDLAMETASVHTASNHGYLGDLRAQAKELDAGWMFPSAEGTLRTPNSLARAWAKCLKHAKITKRFTVHGLRYTFTDLVRRANLDAVVRRL